MALQHIRSLLKLAAESNGFDRVLSKIKVVSAGSGQLVAEMKVDEEHLNSFGFLHGGMIATLVDNMSSFALVTRPNQNRGSSIKVLSAGDGKIVAEMKVEEEHTNEFKILHGGMTATIVDVITGLSHFTVPNGTNPSVSTNISVSYLNAAKLGDEILISANTLKAGRTLAFLEIKITDKNSGKVIATGSHTKYVFKE